MYVARDKLHVAARAAAGRAPCATCRGRQAKQYPYFLALQQDYEQMPRQQLGLRDRGLGCISLVHEEVSIARFHSVLDRYLAGDA